MIQGREVVCRNVTVKARWIIGADGLHSHVRRWAGLDRYLWNRERIAFRQHFAVDPPPKYVQVLWAEAGQCYITPVGGDEISVAVITSGDHSDFRDLLSFFPTVADSLPRSIAINAVRGSLTASRRLRRVCADSIALVGEASGSVDAITGEGICLALQQAEALADAIASGELAIYSRKYRRIMRRPTLMAAALTALSDHHTMRRRILKGLSQDPQLFGRMLGFHVGAAGFRSLGLLPSFKLGTALLPFSEEASGKRR